ncbi:MAG: DEAD/DEAH box helicase [bacterium]|nr:DEAD/DEAH box helicase [bacterium]
MYITKKTLKEAVNTYYFKGANYFDKYINLINITHTNDEKKYRFRVESEKTYNFYDVIINSNGDGVVTDVSCDCPNFFNNYMCKHVAAVLIKYNKLIFKTKREELNEQYQTFNKIISELEPTKRIKKELVSLEVEILPKDTTFKLNLRIGQNKKYIIKNKIDDFLTCYTSKKNKVEFGKGFTYYGDIHYFDESDSKILEYVLDKTSFDGRYTRYKMEFPYYFLDTLLKMLKERTFKYNHHQYKKIVDGNPFTFILKEDNFDNYILTYSINKPQGKICTLDNARYIVTDEVFYKTDSKTKKVLQLFNKYNTNKIIFKKTQLPSFISNVFTLVKDNIEIKVDDLKEQLTINSPSFKYYLDYIDKILILELKIEYNGILINFFDSVNFMRDIDEEEKTVNYLLDNGFIINEKKQRFELEDVEKVGIFLEETIEEIKKNNEVFITDKVKYIDVKKKMHFTSSFSIGKDNIMNYKFELDGIKGNELDDIIATIKTKKKYHRLKDGKIINVEKNKDIEDIKNLIDDLDIAYSALEKEGIIPKYKAIYIDSIKDKNSSMINTDNLFQQLVDNFYKYKDLDINLSKKDRSILREYQVTGIKWLNNIYKCGFGGILADEMGLGKSIQIIYLIKERLKENNKLNFLIVAPTSLIYNWENEFNKFGKELNYQVFAENKNKRHEKLKTSKNINIYITTYGLIRHDIDIYKKMSFDCVIIDEAQNIKNPLAGLTKAVKMVNANTKFALTGTPLENSILELWSIFDFIMPGYLSTANKFQKRYNISDFDDKTNTLLERLNKQISSFILRRKKKDVLKELPEKLENNIFIDLYDRQKILYAAEIKKVNDEIDMIIARDGYNKAKFLIFPLLTRLRQICIEPSLYLEGYKGGSSKIDELINVLQGVIQNGHKVLLFSNFKSALILLKSVLKQNKISYYTIDGSVTSKKRMELVEKFNQDDTNVFLITLKAGGTGLNLTSADVVIHLDMWWNPQAENQATDRAHRIGQKNTVEVIKFITRGTIEERILELQEKKKMLSDKLIEGEDRDKNLLSSLSEKEIRNLLAYENEQ